MTASKTPKLPKREIKENILALLKGKTPAGSRVYLSRGTPTQSEETPVVLIYSTGESIGLFDESQKRYRRVMEIRIECIAQGETQDDLDLRLEDIAERVEALMERDETFGGIVSSLELIGTDYQWESTADAPLGVLALRYGLTFFTYAQREGEVCLDDFKTAQTGWDIGSENGPPDSDVDATDTITLPLV